LRKCAQKEKAKHQATKAPQSQDKLPDLNLKLIISDDNRKVLLHTPDSNGDYAMHAACRNPNTETTREVVSTLLRIGFNEFNKANADGDTVLDVLLARPDSTELKDLVDNLRTLGACPNKTYDTDTCGDMNPPEEKLDIDLALMGGNNTDPADHV
jgi:ankyrin repeat protein